MNEPRIDELVEMGMKEFKKVGRENVVKSTGKTVFMFPFSLSQEVSDKLKMEFSKEIGVDPEKVIVGSQGTCTDG